MHGFIIETGEIKALFNKRESTGMLPIYNSYWNRKDIPEWVDSIMEHIYIQNNESVLLSVKYDYITHDSFQGCRIFDNIAEIHYLN